MNDQNDWYNVLGNSEPYQFEPLVLEEESYASNDTLDGLKRERLIHFLCKCLLYHWNEYVQEFLQEVLWSFSLTPLSFSIRFLLRSRVRRAPLWMRMQMQNGIVIQSYLHSCTARCDVMFLSIPFYKTKVIIILVFWCNCVGKTVYLWPFNYAHLVREHLMP